MIEIFTISWSQLNAMVFALANNIRASGKYYNTLFPVATGGYPVAILLSSVLKIPIVLDAHHPTSLIVDDLIDSGVTLKKFPFRDKAVLIVKNNRVSEVNYYSTLTVTDEWIKFPWEHENDFETHVARLCQFCKGNQRHLDIVRRALDDTSRV